MALKLALKSHLFLVYKTKKKKKKKKSNQTIENI
jgi:hypothetical protein